MKTTKTIENEPEYCRLPYRLRMFILDLLYPKLSVHYSYLEEPLLTDEEAKALIKNWIESGDIKTKSRRNVGDGTMGSLYDWAGVARIKKKRKCCPHCNKEL